MAEGCAALQVLEPAGLLCLRCSPRPELSVGHLDGDRLRRCVALEELRQVVELCRRWRERRFCRRGCATA